MTVVLDAGPMIAYLRGEPGADVVADAMAGPENAIYAHGVNIIEVYYDFLRVSDRATAASAVVTLVGDGVTIREDLDAALRSDVGALKAEHAIALADCFALALARRLGAELLTTDHHELDPLVPLGVCPIRFIR